MHSPRWPSSFRRRYEALQNQERYLHWSGGSVRIRKPTPTSPELPRNELPTSLRQCLVALEDHALSGARLSNVLTASLVRDTWHLLERADEELGPSVPIAAIEGGWPLLLRICELVARGMAYVPLPLRTLLQARVPAWEREQDPLDRRSIRDRIEMAELLIASTFSAASTDLRSLAWLAQQPLRGGFRGLCRHYAQAVVLLFAIAKAATGKHSSCHVVPMAGRERNWSLIAHAWNWFVEADTGHVFAFDLTAADWRWDRGEAPQLFNEGFNASDALNASVFVTSLLAGFGVDSSPFCGASFVETTLRQMLDLDTPRGQTLIYGLSRQWAVPDEVRGWCMLVLEERGFPEVFPGWDLGLDSSVDRGWSQRLASRRWGDTSRALRLLEALR